MKEFKKDPIDSIRYILGLERSKDGYEIAKQVHDHYLNPNKEYEEQLDEIEKVRYVLNYIEWLKYIKKVFISDDVGI